MRRCPSTTVRVDTRTGGPGTLPDRWSIPLTLTAEALLYGERVTLDPVTIGNAEDADNPLRCVLPPIKGDAITGLRVEVAPASPGVGESGTVWATASASGSVAAVEPLFVDFADAAADGTSTGTYSTVTSTDHMFNHYFLAEPTEFVPVTVATGVDLPHVGRYKMWLHVAGGGSPEQVSVADVDFELSLRGDGTLTKVSTARVTSQSGDGRRQWLDLGEVPVPGGVLLPADVVAEGPHRLTFRVTVSAADGGATSDVRIDALVFQPVDGPEMTAARTMATTFNGLYVLDGAHVGTWDTDDATSWLVTASLGRLRSAVTLEAGGFPVADPAAAANEVWVFPLSVPTHVDGTDDTLTAITATWMRRSPTIRATCTCPARPRPRERPQRAIVGSDLRRIHRPPRDRLRLGAAVDEDGQRRPPVLLVHHDVAARHLRRPRPPGPGVDL